MSTEAYVFAGGGTGGHLFPGLAVAEELRRHQPHAAMLFLTTTRALDRELLARVPFEQIEQPVQPLSLHPLRFAGFWRAWRRSLRLATQVLRARRPRAVLGLGGYAAGPAVVAARRLGIRRAILNPDAIPGRANRRLARYADLVVLQWDDSRRYFRAGTPCRTLGCPIRADFLRADGAAGRRRFGLDERRPLLLVTGASQGARTINRAVQRVWPEFVREFAHWQLVHLSGAADEAETRDAYAKAGAPATVVAFTHEMAEALAAADLVVSRAGASTLAELTALGKPSILLPYPYHRDRHQHANAQVLADVGAAVVLEDQRDAARNAEPLLAALRLLAIDAAREKMSAAARTLARPRAAADMAAWLAGGEPQSRMHTGTDECSTAEDGWRV